MKRFKGRGYVVSFLMLLVLALVVGGGVAQGAAGQVVEVSAASSSLAAPVLDAAAADISIDKVVEPDRVPSGDPVVYTITFENKGRDAGILEEIEDTLPPGFSFAGIEPESDIQQAPEGNTGLILWQGPFTVPARDSLTLIYRARTGGSGSNLVNKVSTVVDGQTVGPASASVQVDERLAFLPMLRNSFSHANFSIAKSASPPQVNVEEKVTYTVTIRNEGDLPGKLDKVSDTLPQGFTFVSMVSGSDIMTSPAGTTGTVVWDLSRDVAAKAEVKLIYQAMAGAQGGTFTNSATATTLVGSPPEKAATASVKVIHPSSFEDDFEDGDQAWTPYENHKRANADMWTWSTTDCRNGSNGCYYHNAMHADQENRYAHDAISMYLGEGSQDWTDYRYTAWFNMFGGRQVGIWFRGHYRDVDVDDGQWFTGYYFTVQVRDGERDRAKLWQLRTFEERGNEIYDFYLYHYQNPLDPPLDWVDISWDANVEKGEWHKLTVEVRGNNIKGYVNDELAIDFTDDVGSIFLTGTIGFYAYGNDTAYSVIKFDDVKVEPLD